jgi:hypothetical protein
MCNKRNTMILAYTICFGLNCFAQNQTVKPDLSIRNSFQLVNRDVALSTNEQGKTIVHLNNKPGNGVAWIKNLSFEKGVIEFDAKGKNILQQSFIGIAFHGVNDSTFDAIYFRPFNFQSPHTLRKSHSVQYVSLPQNDWSVLREKYPGKYENALSMEIDPESWFHVRVVVDASTISVFANGEERPCLVVKPLANHSKGKVGFWVGNNSDGDFSNLSIETN